MDKFTVTFEVDGVGIEKCTGKIVGRNIDGIVTLLNSELSKTSEKWKGKVYHVIDGNNVLIKLIVDN